MHPPHPPHPPHTTHDTTAQARKLSGGANKGGAQRALELERCLTNILFAYAYPRLDAEVSKKMNHLLKVRGCCCCGGGATRSVCACACACERERERGRTCTSRT
jgi:hypothetical protein